MLLLPSRSPEEVCQTDSDGLAQATVLFLRERAAQLVMPDNSTVPISSLNIRATE